MSFIPDYTGAVLISYKLSREAPHVRQERQRVLGWHATSNGIVPAVVDDATRGCYCLEMNGPTFWVFPDNRRFSTYADALDHARACLLREAAKEPAHEPPKGTIVG